MTKNTENTLFMLCLKSFYSLKENFNVVSFFLLTCDAPDFWQLSFQDPASSIMEGILLFKINLFSIVIQIFILGTIIGWSSVISMFKQPSNLKQNLANIYIIFLVSVLNHGRVPDKFIFFTTTLGIFLARDLIILLGITHPSSFLVMLFFPFFFVYLVFIIFYGYFVLSRFYPKKFGKYLVDFFENNASKPILKIINAESKNFELKKKKKKSTYRKRSISKKLKKRNFKTRKYSTTTAKFMDPDPNNNYEVYAQLKTAAWIDNSEMALNRASVMEVGRARFC